LFDTEEKQSAIISFKAKIYADGQWDHSWRSINKPAKVKKDGFIGEKRKKIPLMFDLTMLEGIEDEKDDDLQDNNKRTLRKRKNTKKEDTKKGDDDNSIDEKKPEDQEKFGHGAISVYFFNAKDIEKNETTIPVPLAALHLHYRSTKWLLERNILVEEKSDDVFDEVQATKDVDEMAQQDVQETKKVKPEAKRKTTQSRKGKNKKEKVTTAETTTMMEIEEPAGSDCDISEWTGKLDLGPTEVEEENQEAKKKSRGKKEKKIVEEVKNETESNVESGTKRYNLRARK
jgi:hypothetical protein